MKNNIIKNIWEIALSCLNLFINLFLYIQESSRGKSVLLENLKRLFLKGFPVLIVLIFVSGNLFMLWIWILWNDYGTRIQFLLSYLGKHFVNSGNFLWIHSLLINILFSMHKIWNCSLLCVMCLSKYWLQDKLNSYKKSQFVADFSTLIFKMNSS